MPDVGVPPHRGRFVRLAVAVVAIVALMVAALIAPTLAMAYYLDSLTR